MSDEAHPHEIIIIKRHGGSHEDGHHGGAWKIAYADFVTAMMAFFLVMWLLSANEKTKAAVVKYFNPVQLVDSTPQPPGLSDPGEKSPNPKNKTAPKSEAESSAAAPPSKESPVAKEGGKKEGKKTESKAKDEAEAALFKDPYAVLAEIASKDASTSSASKEASTSSTGKGSADGSKAPTDGFKGGSGAAGGAAGARGGEAFRDPFDPQAISVPASDAPADPAGPPPAATDAASATSGAATSGSATPAALSSAPLPAEPVAKAAELKNRIDTLMKTVMGGGSAAGPKLDVKATPEGVLIGLTDDAKFSMFASASAQPSPATVGLMEKIGQLLKTQKGRIVIRGFTDSRKFKSDTYDNWRLSSARAHMAHYMLARGGLDDARVEMIEGYADHQPRNAKDPDAPENRRIEILLKEKP